MVLTSSDNGKVNIWDVDTGVKIADPLRHQDKLLWVGFDASGNKIYSVSSNGNIRTHESGLGLDLNYPDWFPKLARNLVSTKELNTDRENAKRINQR